MPDSGAFLDPTRHPQFAVVFRGYDPALVDQYVKQVTRELDMLARHREEAAASVAELTKALSYAQQELADTKGALQRMVADPGGAAAMSDRVKAMMRLAEEETAELREKAEREAAGTREAADSYADKTRRKAQDAAEQLRRDAEARRAAADKRAQHEIKSKWTQAERAIADKQARAQQQADKLVADAEARLAEAAATRKQALELQAVVVDRFTAGHTALVEAMHRLGCPPESGEQKVAPAQRDAETPPFVRQPSRS